MFNRFIGAKKPAVPKEEEKPIDMSKMTDHMSTLDRKEEQITKKIQSLDQQLVEIRQQLTKPGGNYTSLRARASNLMKQRKMYQNQLSSVSNMNLTMGQTAMTIENVQMMQDQFKVMKEVSAAQSEMFKSVNINEFMDLNDQMQDMREDMDDVQEMMMDGMSGDVEMDEEQLDQELANISLESLPSSAMNVPTSAVPSASAQPQAYNMNENLSRL